MTSQYEMNFQTPAQSKQFMTTSLTLDITIIEHNW